MGKVLAYATSEVEGHRRGGAHTGDANLKGDGSGCPIVRPLGTFTGVACSLAMPSATSRRRSSGAVSAVASRYMSQPLFVRSRLSPPFNGVVRRELDPALDTRRLHLADAVAERVCRPGALQTELRPMDVELEREQPLLAVLVRSGS